MASDAVALTQFPELSSTYDASSKEVSISNFAVDNDLEVDTITRGWALLLRAYTGEEVLAFTLNDGQVRIDLASLEVEKVSGANPGSRATAVYLLESQESSLLPGHSNVSDSSGELSSFTTIHHHAVSLTYVRQSGKCRLRSATGILPAHIEELGLQFRSSILQARGVEANSAGHGGCSMAQSVINPHPISLEGPQLLHQLVFRPDYYSEIALDFRNSNGSRTTLSYGALRHQALLFAEKLQSCFAMIGISDLTDEQHVIPVLIPQSAELYVALLGILEAGAAFCPINLDAPSERIKFIIQDVAANVVVSTAKDVSSFESIADITFCVIDDIPTFLSDNSQSRDIQHEPPLDSSGPNLSSNRWAYIMYTSGSTGQPKGVILSHLAVTQSLLAHDRHVPKFSRFLQFASPTFDVSMFEIFFTFQRGSTLVGCSRTELLNDLPGMISELNIDAAELTPTVAGTLLRTREEVPSLRLLLTIGEMLTKAVVEEFGASDTKLPMLYGMYGPTEAAIHCTLQPKFAVNEKVGLIGEPFDTVSAFIAEPVPSDRPSESLIILPVGHIGELVVGGPQLAHGYLNREEQTKKVFFDHPEYGMLYRTGDKARMLPNGILECLGRIQSGQVKLRGQRIELGEIEQAGMRTEGCQLAVANVIRDNLVLFCLVSSNVSNENVKETCRKWLLPHMMPNEILLHSSFPQLPSGKVDKKTLEKEYLSESSDNQSQNIYTGDPDLVRQVCEILKTILGIDVSPQAELSKVGVDSLRAIQLASEIRRRGLFNLGAVDVLKANSIEVICATLSPMSTEKFDANFTGVNFDSLRAHVMEHPEIAKQSSEVLDVVCCTPLQIAMLAETMKDPRAYCNWIEITIDGNLTTEEVAKAFEELINANEILKSGFVETEDSSIGFARVVWKRCTKEQIRQRGRPHNHEFVIESSSHLLRPLSVSIDNSSEGMSALLQIHHALYDGWSMDLILKDLNSILGGSSIKQRPSFRRVAEYFAQVSNSHHLDKSRDYWESQLESIHPAGFPKFPQSTPPSTSSSLLTYIHEIPSHSSPGLDALPFHPQVSLQLAIACLWASYIGSNDVVLGSVSAGRALPVDDIEDIIGPCIATLPLRLNLANSSTIGAAMRQIQEQNRLALEHSALPLRDIKTLANINPVQSLFEVVFIWQESIESKSSDLTKARVTSSADFLESKLLIEAEPHQHGLTLKCSQQEEYLPSPMMEILLKQISAIYLFLNEKGQNSLNLPLAELWETLDETLLSVGEFTHETSSLNSHDQLSDQRLDCYGAIISDPLLHASRHVLPLGGLGRLFTKDANHLKSTLVSSKDIRSYESDKYGQLHQSNLLVRALPDKALQLCGTSEEYDTFHNELIETKKISTCVQESANVGGCRTLVIGEQPKAILVAFWIPQEILQTNDFVNGDVNKLHKIDITASHVETVNRIMEHLSESFPQHLLPSYLIPISAFFLDDVPEAAFHEFYESLEDISSLHYSGLIKMTELENDSWDKTDIERSLTQALSETIKDSPDKISRTSSFFRLGLDSVSAISFSRKLKSGPLELNVDVATILRNPSVGRLASHLIKLGKSQEQDNYESQKTYIQKDILFTLKQKHQSEGLDVERVRPCTPLQEGMLASSGSNAYFNHSVFEIRQPPKLFRKAFGEIFNRHDIFRTCFSTTTEPQLPFAQIVLRDIPVPWRLADGEKETLESVMANVEATELQALDTTKPPFAITHLGGKDMSFLILSLHHALYDAEAMSQVLWEVEQLLKGYNLPSPPSFDNFLLEALYPSYERADAFWLRLFEDFHPKTLIPGKLSSKRGLDVARKTLTHRHTSKISLKDLESAARTHSVTLSTLVQAAWSKVISAATGATDVSYGQVLNGRSLPVTDIEYLVAPCFNTVPVRVRFHSDSTNEEMLQQLQQVNADILSYPFMPLRRLQSQLHLDGSPLFDTLVLMQKPVRRLDDSLWILQEDVGNMGLPLICEVVPDPDADLIQVTLHADGSILAANECEDLSKAFKSALDTFVKAPHGKAVNFTEIGLYAWRGDLDNSTLQNEKNEHAANIPTADGPKQTQMNDLESTIQRVIANFTRLPSEQITRDKSVFRLGVDSIMAIQIAKVLRTEGVDILAQHIMENKSVGGIASCIQQAQTSDDHSQSLTEQKFDLFAFDEQYRSSICEENGLQHNKLDSVLPCTQVQAGMISQYLNSNGEMYLNHFLYEIPDYIDLTKLRQAWEAVLKRHQMLRVGFVSCESSKAPFVMIVHRPTALELPWVEKDFTHHGDEAALKHDILPEKRREFERNFMQNLKNPPWVVFILSLLVQGKKKRFLNLSILHALYDAESLRMILDDVEQLYQGRTPQQPPRIEPLLSHILNKNKAETAHQEFWQTALHDVPINKFPNLNPLHVNERRIRTYTETTRDFQAIAQGCRSLGVTLQAALQVTWARLLADYLAESDIVFGMVLAGRESEGADDTAFPSTNTVPCRINVHEDTNGMLQEVMQYNSAIRKHQHASLPQVARWAGCQGSSIFDTLLVYQTLDPQANSETWWVTIDEKAAVEYPLSIEVSRDGLGGLQVRLVFFDDVLPLDHASLLGRQFISVLKQVTMGERGKYGTPYNDLQLLSKLEPATREIPSKANSLHDFVKHTAESAPSRLALEFFPSADRSGSAKWTYAELEAEGNKVANLITGLGIKARSLVAVCFDKCAEASFTILGILKAGCAYVALDPTAPDSRKSFILEDSEAAMLLTTSDISKDLNLESQIRVICMDAINGGQLDASVPSTADQVQGSDPCYCLYTSGSSGTPKGCIITHENVVQAMLAFRSIFAGRWDDSSRWLQFASFHFDVSVLEQFWSWSVGVCVVSTPRDVLFSDLVGVLNKLEITHIDLTPSLARLITPEEIPMLCKGVFITGGEPLKQEVLDAWGPIEVIHNGYGPTECTIGCTMYPRVPANGKPSNIGWQFENVGTYVFKPDTTEIVPRGGVGELCVSGKLVGQGYLKRPELTEESFTYISEYDERVYRTKDLVRMLSDGSFDFLGRNDDQVKLRGQRLELGEINNALKSNHDLAEEVNTIIIKRNANESEQLVSFVAIGNQLQHTSKEEQSKLAESLREICEMRLPNYMVPSRFILLETIPLTANNKIDTNTLKGIFQDHLDKDLAGADASDAPQTASENEKAISNIVASFLSITRDTVTSKSNLFELGLDSISAFGLARVLQNQGYRNMSAATIMKQRSIKELADAFGHKQISTDDAGENQARHEIGSFQRKNKSAAARSLGVSPSELESVVPCTPLQHGTIAKGLQSGHKPYFNTILYEVDQSAIENQWMQLQASPESRETLKDERSRQFNGDSSFFMFRLKTVIDETAATVSILKTTFASTQEGYAQAVFRQQIPETCQICSTHSSETIQDAVQRHRSIWLEKNKDAFKLPFQACLFQCRETSTVYLALNIFHGLYDATSLPLLLESIAEKLIGSDPVRQQTTSFHEALPYGPLRKHPYSKQFWKDHLTKSAFQPLAASKSSEKTSHNTHHLCIDNLNKLEEVRRQLNVTHQALVQAAWMASFQEWCQFPNTFGMVVSGRSIDLPDADQIIGPMFNTIPFAMRISATDTWRSLARKCHDFNMSALPFQHTPLRDIQKWCGNSSRSNLFDTLFVFQKMPSSDSLKSGKIFKELDSMANPDYPLAFEAEHIGNESLKIAIVAQGGVTAADQSSVILADRFEQCFRALLESPDQNVSDLIDISKIATPAESVETDFGHPTFLTYEEDSFVWTDFALSLKTELATLSGMDTESINAYTSIYQLGLDSIDAIKLSSAMRAKGFHLSMSSILRQQSIQAMDAIVDKTSNTKANKPTTKVSGLNSDIQARLEKLTDAQGETVLPATPLQESIVWEMISSRFQNYFNHDILRIQPSTNIDLLRSAWQKTYECRDILRTGFCEVEDPALPYSFAQVINKRAGLKWKEVNLQHSDHVQHLIDQIQDDMTSFMEDEATPRAEKVPFQLTLATVADGTKYLILSLSHALYDGWSLNLLHQDVMDAYHGHLRPRPDLIPVLSKVLEGSNIDSKNFWADYLSEFQGCQFPEPRHNHSNHNEVHRLEKSSSVGIREIREFCKSQNVGIQALGHLCWSAVLASYTRSLDVGFGVVLSGRDDEEAQQLLFPTMNTIVVRSVLAGSRADMLQDAQSSLGDLMQYQFFPLREISALTGLPGQALFNSLFIYQKRPESSSNSESLYESIGGSSNVEYPVCVEVEVIDEELIWRTACSDHALSLADTEELLERLDHVMKEVISSPEASTVQIHGKAASVCGLAEFEESSESALGINNNGKMEDDLETNRIIDLESDDETRRIMASVIETLALVSKVPKSQIRENDTIYHLGLDSISLIKVASALRKHGVHISVGDMLRAGSVRKIVLVALAVQSTDEASGVDTQASLDSAVSAFDIAALVRQLGIGENDVERILPATPAQVFFLSHWQNTGETLFFSTFEYLLEGDIEISKVHSAWKSLIKNNEILRTSFVGTGSREIPILQVVLGEDQSSFLDLSLDSQDPSNIPSSLAPVRLVVKPMKGGNLWLGLQIHHALYDAVSLPRLVQQLEDICRDGTYSSENTEKADFVEFIAQTHSSQIQEAKHNFWKQYLGFTTVNRSAEYKASGNGMGLSNRTSLYRPRTFTELQNLTSVLRKHGIGLQSFFLAVTSHIYAQSPAFSLKGGEPRDHVILGMYLANRSHRFTKRGDNQTEDLTTLAAPTLNLVPLKVNSVFTRSLLDSARQIQQDLQEISKLENSSVGLWEIDEWTGIKIDCFVNFLTLPESDEGRKSTLEEETGSKISISQLEESSYGEDSKILQKDDNTKILRDALQKNVVRDIYVPSVDIEAAVRDGAIDIGIFGPSEMFINHSAEAILEELTQGLESGARAES